MEDTEKNIKKLIIDLSIEQHSKIKIRAANRNVSIKTWVMRAIQMAIIEEDKYK